MAIVINGSGTVTGLAVGGLPDGSVDSDTLASGIDKTSISDSGDATAITIDSSEQVGIGQAPTDYQLVVREPNGDSKVLELSTGDSTCRLAFSRAGDPTAYIDMKEDGATGTGGLHFGTGTSNTPTTTLQLHSDGRGLSQFTAKAWVNFNGSGTIAIRDSHNVSSITDSGTGNYIVNLSNALANTNGVAVTGGDGYNIVTAFNSTSAVSLQNLNTSIGNADNATLFCTIFGD